MISRIITTPFEEKISLDVPPSFIGRRVEVTFVVLDETEAPIPKPDRKLSDMLRGFSKESAESFSKHIKKIREEWDT